MRLLLTAVAVVVLELASSTPVFTQSPDITEVRRRVALFTRRFIAEFSNVVSEEEYDQRFSNNSRRRRLKSDFLLVAYPGRNDLVMMFRDVREVDGKPVSDKQERITKLFLQPFDNAVRRARDIQREGLRHSIDNGRMMDPLTVIAYLQPEYQGGFRISLGDLSPSNGASVREIDLVPTPAAGKTAKPARAWVSETTGDVFRTELREGFGARALVTTTTFGVDPGLKIRVPVEMRDEVPRGNGEFIGTAKYSNFRRFEVKAESVVTVPEPASSQ